jgi:hypothetical protein
MGSGPDEYEDAAWPDVAEWADAASSVRVAIADGASESMLAGRWARLLARTACDHDPGALLDALCQAGRSWPAETAAYLADRPLTWWQREKLSRGAQSTVLVVQVSDEGAWKAAAVGDSCLFHCRDDAVLETFPIARSADFGVRPALVGSRRVGACVPRWAAGGFAAGDLLVLATDALAAWVLRAVEAGESPVGTLRGLTSGPDSDALASWAEAERGADPPALRNDDLTVVSLQL